MLDEMPVAEKRLAEFVLDFPGDIASYTASELAELAEVSNSTISRFVRRLGYAGYDDARKHIRQIRETGSPLFLSSTAKSAGKAKSVQAHLAHGQSNLLNTFSRISDELISEIARAIIDARQVLVVGYRSSHAIAAYFRWQIIQIQEHAVLVPGAGETAGEYLGTINKNDCVVVFGLRRRVPQTRALLGIAARSGARVLYVADQQAASHADATWVIHCDTSAPGPLDNHVSVMALCGVLATRVMEMAGNSGRQRMGAIEQAHDAMDEME